MLKQRILTALILLPLMLIMLFCANSAIWALFSSAIALIGLWEYSGIAKLNYQQQQSYLIGAAIFMFTAYLGNWQLPPLIWAIVLLFWLFGMPFWLRRKWRVHDHIVHLAIGYLLILPFWFALLWLRETQSASQLLLLMMIVWIADIGAYFVGKKWGKRKLAPQISPNKSLEGALGGLIGVLLFLNFAYFTGCLHLNLSWFATMLLGFLLTAISIGGDLLESWLKRCASIKDSSHLLPGHGGVLDRIDSLIAVLSAYAAILVLFG